jgi:hypothetical protein
MGHEGIGFYGLQTCGYGTHTEKCGERVVYAHADARGGCEQTCDDRVFAEFIDPRWKSRHGWDPATFCSDGGEGSRRVLFRMPKQRDPRGTVAGYTYRHRHEIRVGSEFDTEYYRFFDFACSYGTQCQACGPRKTVSVRDVHDEMDIPSGPLYKNCESAPDGECCATLQKFHINKNNYDDASVTSCSGICALLGRDGEDGACLPENPQCNNWHTKDRWPMQGDTTYSEEVGAWCLCSGKSRGRQPKATIFDGVSNVPTASQLARSIPAGSAATSRWSDFDGAGVVSGYGSVYQEPSWPDRQSWTTDPNNPLAQGRRRALGNESARRRLDAYDGRWAWPGATVKGIASFHGDHLDLGDRCLAALYNYRLQNVQNDTSGYDYHTLTTPPFDSWSASDHHDVLDCRNETVVSTDVCVVAKGTFSASRVYLWTAQPTLTNAVSFMKAYGASYAIGRSVYSDAAIAIGNFDSGLESPGVRRERRDVVLGNRLFLSSQSNGKVAGDFGQTDGLRIGSRAFSGVWVGDVDGVYPDDVVGRHEDDGSVVVYFGYLDEGGRLPATPAGLGFRYGGELVSGEKEASVTTVSFVNTISGYGTDCRTGGVFGCITHQKAIFVGTGDGSSDMIWTTARSSQPFRTAFVGSNAGPCPVSSNGVDFTMPVRSYKACVAAAAMLRLGQPGPDAVATVGTLKLPLYACVVIS